MILRKAFAELRDPRVKRTRIHPLESILTIAILSILADGDGWEDMNAYGTAHYAFLKDFIDIAKGIPSADTFRRVMSMLDPEAFRQCFTQWVQDLHPPTPNEIIAVDGKTAKHSFDRATGKSPIHMVSAFAAERRLVLGQRKTHDKSNEITTIPELLRMLRIEGCIVTIDAMGCQREIAEQIGAQGADFVLALKDNQLTLHNDVKLHFDAPPPDTELTTTVQVDKGHGRVETRRVTVSGDIDSFVDATAWPTVRSVIRVESRREVRDAATGQYREACDVRHYISSLPQERAPKIAEAIRAHWSIENQLHWVLDVTFGEDDSRIRRDYGPENLATLRHIALNLFRGDNNRKITTARKRKFASWAPTFALNFLLQRNPTASLNN